MSATGEVVRAASTALEYKLRKLQIIDYAAYAKLTLLMYEIIINLGREAQLVWSTTEFRWSNVIYYMNRYPVVVFQIWSVCYTPNTPQYVLKLFVLRRIPRFTASLSCDALYQFFWYASFIPTRVAITASFALRVYAIMETGMVLVVVLSTLGLAIVGLDIWQGVQSTCTQSSDKLSTILTFIFLACFDVMATVIVTVRMVQTIRLSGGFKALDNQHIAGYILRSGVLYFGVVTIPQLIAIALYFAPQGLYSTVLNNFMLVLSSIMVARFLLDLREMNENNVVVYSNDTQSLSVSMPFEAAENPATAHMLPRARPRRGRLDHTSLVRDFGDYDSADYSEGSSDFTMTRFKDEPRPPGSPTRLMDVEVGPDEEISRGSRR